MKKQQIIRFYRNLILLPKNNSLVMQCYLVTIYKFFFKRQNKFIANIIYSMTFFKLHNL